MAAPAPETSTMAQQAPAPHHLVVGAGVFGVSTALHLLACGHAVTLLERSPDGLAAVDAASNDVNKIIRADYQDKHYAALAKRAISAWRSSPLFAPFYHEVGLLLHSGPAPPQDGRAYVQNGIARAHAEVLESDGAGAPFVETPAPGSQLPPKAHALSSDADAAACFPASLRSKLGPALRDMGGTQSAYVNPRAGWAEAGNATHAAQREAVRLGARVEGDALVTDFVREKDAVVGVRADDGREWRTQNGGKVVLCAGAWAHDLLHRLGAPAPHPCTPSAQSVILLQLDEEQRAAFRSAPVVLNFSTGFYIFEPDEHGVLKCAIHGSGWPLPRPPLHAVASYPGFSTSTEPGNMPVDHVERMLEALYDVYPSLRSAKLIGSRICWYSDTLDENWLIDDVEGTQGRVVVAGGDSGHGFKFLPTIGELICARMGIAGVPPLTSHQARVFSAEHHASLRAAAKAADAQRFSDNIRGRL